MPSNCAENSQLLNDPRYWYFCQSVLICLCLKTSLATELAERRVLFWANKSLQIELQDFREVVSFSLIILGVLSFSEILDWLNHAAHLLVFSMNSFELWLWISEEIVHHKLVASIELEEFDETWADERKCTEKASELSSEVENCVYVPVVFLLCSWELKFDDCLLASIGIDLSVLRIIIAKAISVLAEEIEHHTVVQFNQVSLHPIDELSRDCWS